MTSSLTPRRPLAALVAFALSFVLFYLANILAADVRYPLAIFCFILSIVSFGVGLCLLSRRLGQAFANIVATIVEFF
jgi:hypothetical protein